MKNEKKKCNIKLSIVIAALALLFFCGILIAAILYKTDGVGILAICGSVVFFSLLILRKPKTPQEPPNNPNNEDVDIVRSNASDFIEYLNGPEFKRFFMAALIQSLNYLENNLDKLSNEQCKKLKIRFANLLQKLDAQPEEPLPPPPSTPLQRKMKGGSG